LKPVILYLTYDGLTDPLGQSQVLPYLCGLSPDYAISIISFEKTARFKESESKIAEICSQHNIHWHPLRYHKNPPVLATLFDIGKLWFKARQLYKLDGVSVVHCRSYITALVGLWMKRKYTVKFIFDMRGFWADERVDGGLWNLKNPLYRTVYSFFKKKEKEFLAEADHVVSLTEAAVSEMKTWNISLAPITVIPTCVDLELFNPQKIKASVQAKVRTELGLTLNDFVLVYSGSIGTWYLLDEMLTFFSQLKKEKPEAKFLILTRDSLALEDYPYRQDVIITAVEYNMMPTYLSLGTAAVFFIKPAYSKKASSATKMAELMAMKLPFVANSKIGDVESLTSQYPEGIVLEEFTATAYQQAIVRLGIKKGDYNPAVLNYFSLTRGINLYRSVYAACMDNRNK
jgi:glycosyltransferase involved in cell wall biosynthesis